MADRHFKFLNHDKLPCLLQPQEDKQANVNYLIKFLQDENPLFKEYLLNYGAILLRGFHVNSAEKFSDVIGACSLGAVFNYDDCPLPRTKIKEGVYTSINAPESINIPMHNEKSYHPIFPDHIYFNCIQAAKRGGITPLVDAHKLWLSLPDALQKKLQTKGIAYCNVYYADGVQHKCVRLMGGGHLYRTWNRVFQTDRKKEVEQILNESNAKFRWTSNNNLIIERQKLPAYRHHPVNNKAVWFNQSDHNNQYYNAYYRTSNSHINVALRFMLSYKSFFSYVAFYGDGEPISRSEADQMNVALQKHKISIPWQQGDVMVLDNYLCMHGKEPHSGERLILTSMTK